MKRIIAIVLCVLLMSSVAGGMPIDVSADGNSLILDLDFSNYDGTNSNTIANRMSTLTGNDIGKTHLQTGGARILPTKGSHTSLADGTEIPYLDFSGATAGLYIHFSNPNTSPNTIKSDSSAITVESWVYEPAATVNKAHVLFDLQDLDNPDSVASANIVDRLFTQWITYSNIGDRSNSLNVMADGGTTTVAKTGLEGNTGAGNWKHIATTRKVAVVGGVNVATYTLYIDGEPVATGTKQNVYSDGFDFMTIGTQGIYSGGIMTGGIASFKLYNEALEASEVKTNFDDTKQHFVQPEPELPEPQVPKGPLVLDLDFSNYDGADCATITNKISGLTGNDIGKTLLQNGGERVLPTKGSFTSLADGTEIPYLDFSNATAGLYIHLSNSNTGANILKSDSSEVTVESWVFEPAAVVSKAHVIFNLLDKADANNVGNSATVDELFTQWITYTGIGDRSDSLNVMADDGVNTVAKTGLGGNIGQGNWKHIVTTRKVDVVDGANIATYTLYVDGNKVSVGSKVHADADGKRITKNGWDLLTIGCQSIFTSGLMMGGIANFKVYSESLDEATVRSNYLADCEKFVSQAQLPNLFYNTEPVNLNSTNVHFKIIGSITNTAIANGLMVKDFNGNQFPFAVTTGTDGFTVALGDYLKYADKLTFTSTALNTDCVLSVGRGPLSSQTVLTRGGSSINSVEGLSDFDVKLIIQNSVPEDKICTYSVIVRDADGVSQKAYCDTVTVTGRSAKDIIIPVINMIPAKKLEVYIWEHGENGGRIPIYETGKSF